MRILSNKFKARGEIMPVINYIGKNMKTYSVSKHHHDYWEMIYCTNGEGKVTFENTTTLEYTKNQIVLVPPNTVHTNTSEKGFKNIHLTVANWTPAFKKPTLISDNSQKDIYNVLSMCYRYFNTEVYNQSRIIVSLTELLLDLLTSFSGDNHTSQHIDKIASKIIDNFYDPYFVIDDIYKEFSLSKDYLRRQFIKEKGISPLQFLNNTRIAFAQKLLLSKNINNFKIYEIAEMCGFNDQLYFSRVFKKISGCSPKEYTNPKVKDYNSELDTDK